MVGIHSTVGKQAKRMPDTTVETTQEMNRQWKEVIKVSTYKGKVKIKVKVKLR